VEKFEAEKFKAEKFKAEKFKAEKFKAEKFEKSKNLTSWGIMDLFNSSLNYGHRSNLFFPACLVRLYMHIEASHLFTGLALTFIMLQGTFTNRTGGLRFSQNAIRNQNEKEFSEYQFRKIRSQTCDP
jgi:hypothetical protein